MPKLADSWILVGERTFTPDDSSGVIGGISLSDEDDTIWVRVTNLNQPGPWPWSYGILGWQTSQGYELGSIKCFSDSVGEVAKLGVGLRPVVRTGELVFRPRSYNLAWIKNGNPWTLRFEAKVGSSSSGGDLPEFGYRATLGVLSDLAGSVINYAITDGVARVLLPLP
jgi:hypothetical protein